MTTVADNRHSQAGGETLIAPILRVISALSQDSGLPPLLIEFGGSTGSKDSNFFRFMEDGWEAVFIEADIKRFRTLQKTSSQFSNLKTIHAKVGWTESDNLAKILGDDANRVAAVSIDIDGDDALVFSNLGLRPKMVVIEYNPTMPFDMKFSNPKGCNMGNSAAYIVDIAESLGFYLAGITRLNLIFLDKDLKKKFPPIKLVESAYLLELPRIAVGYDGSLIVQFTNQESSNVEPFYDVSWNGAILNQPLPKFLRQYTSGNKWLRIAYSVVFAPHNWISYGARLMAKFMARK